MSITRFYMDTNVFISTLKDDDPYHSAARGIIKSIEGGEIHAETSVITLLEVASVSGRMFAISRKKRTDRERKLFIVRTLQRLAGLITNFINVAGDTPTSIKSVDASLPSIFNEAILLSLQTNLRTLDLIHLGAAKHGKLMNDGLGAFVTGDSEFISNKKGLAKIVGMPILSPKEYVEGLGIR
jgi:predicted nucleic acid-binding protein